MSDEHKNSAEVEEQKTVNANDELTSEELDQVAGGIISPRDPASGLPTGKRSDGFVSQIEFEM